MKNEFKKYRRTQIAEMVDWTPDFDMTGVSVSAEDVKAGSPKAGDKIARNPKNHADKWLVVAAYFADNFEPLTPESAPEKEGEKGWPPSTPGPTHADIRAGLEKLRRAAPSPPVAGEEKEKWPSVIQARECGCKNCLHRLKEWGLAPSPSPPNAEQGEVSSETIITTQAAQLHRLHAERAALLACREALRFLLTHVGQDRWAKAEMALAQADKVVGK